MKIPFSKEEALALRQACLTPGCRSPGTDAYVVDLAMPTRLSLSLFSRKDGVEVLAAEELASRDTGRWYLSGPVADAAPGAALRTLF